MTGLRPTARPDTSEADSRPARDRLRSTRCARRRRTGCQFEGRARWCDRPWCGCARPLRNRPGLGSVRPRSRKRSDSGVKRVEIVGLRSD